jgi:hypothetical protein
MFIYGIVTVILQRFDKGLSTEHKESYSIGAKTCRRCNMSPAPTLSNEEWEIVIELLERESSTLLREIRHTDTAKMRELLRRRSELVDGILDRLRRRDALAS